MFLARDLPPFEDNAARTLGFDLTELLQPGETISSATARLRTVSGNDLLPGNHLPDAATVSGNDVAVLVNLDDPAGDLLGNVYSLAFTVATSLGQVLIPWSRFRVVPGFGVTAYAGGSPPAAAPSSLLAASSLYYTLPVLAGGGYLGLDYPLATQGETLFYGVEFAPALSPGETIASATGFLALLTGTDAAVTASPTAYNSGGAAISGSVVTQLLAWPPAPTLAGNVYALNLAAVTSSGQALAAWGRIVIDRIG